MAELWQSPPPVWSEPSLATRAHRPHAQFVNLHKACNATTAAAPAAEAFRFSQLLSLGALVLSERSAAVNEAAYSELVTFAPFVSLGAAVRELQHLGAGGRLALARQRAATFAERFEPSQIFSRAGVWANR